MTLQDLADELRVSIATISRALNRPEDVAAGTRERVLAAIHKHGAKPVTTSRALRTHQTRTIGVIVSDIRNTFFSSAVKTIDDVAQANGYNVLICNADEDPAKEEVSLQLLLDRKVAAVINCSTGANPELLRAFQKSGAILLDFDRASGLSNVDRVFLDNGLGATLATEHLFDLGHRQIAIVSGPQHLSNARGRLTGYRNALRDRKIPSKGSYVFEGNFCADSGYDGARKLFTNRDRPTALFVANMEMTIGVLTYAREKGIRIPGELSLVSFDDSPWAQLIDPPLTVVVQPTDEMARCAMRFLLARLRGGNEVQTKTFPPKLVIRASTTTLECK
jgi:DNA-binding LacI/PurR family transcriptional regulator